MTKKRRSSFRGKVNKDSKRQTSGYGYLNLPREVSVFTPEKGMVTFDIIPYEVTSKRHPDRNLKDDIAVEGNLWYKLPFKRHRDIGSDNEKVVCPSSIGKPCSICEKRAEMIRQDADKADTDALKWSLRNLYCIIPLDSKKHDIKPHVFDIAQSLFQKEINRTLEEDEDYEVFPSLEEGLSLKCRVDMSVIGSGKPFPEVGKITPIKRDEQYTEDILDAIPNLDEVLNILSYKELEAKFLELDEEDVVEDEPKEEGKPAIRRRKRVPVEEKEPEPEEEVEEEKPKRTRRERKEKTEPENKCPHDHKFGEDCDEHDECEKCEMWDECGEEQDKK